MRMQLASTAWLRSRNIRDNVWGKTFDNVKNTSLIALHYVVFSFITSLTTQNTEKT